MGLFRQRKKNDINNEEEFSPTGAGYAFQTGIVKEFISDPDNFLDREIDANGLLGIVNISPATITLRDIFVKKSNDFDLNPHDYLTNPEDAEIMPKNAIIAYIIDDARAKNGQKPFICYPFFPSHISLPVKPGEHVWIVKEENYGRDVYYWMCRKPGIKQTEDTNYTHVERIQIIEEQLDENRKGNLFNIDEFDERKFASFDNIIPPNLPDGVTNDTIVFDSVSYKEDFTSEPVPPVRKNCGDTVIQGSNNALIHLGTEKFFYAYKQSNYFVNGTPNLALSGRSPSSPAIDLCVGRKREQLDGLISSSAERDNSGSINIIWNQRGENYSSIENYEIDKIGSVLSEGYDGRDSVDFSPTNCGARLYLSNNCAVDAAFGTGFDVLGSYGGSSAVSYANHNRMVADGTLRLANRDGESFLDFDPNGNIVMKCSIDNGQQFLALRRDGTSRLQAKKLIEFAVSYDNDENHMPPMASSVTEPYIMYSELRSLLEDMCADITAINASLPVLDTAIAVIYNVLQLGGAYESAKSAVDSALQIVQASSIMGNPAGTKINIASFPVEKAPSPLGRIGTENTVGMRGKIASTKIFGEKNTLP
tara:strand:+ start:1795 stop:3570 length:1776 start_codon:yes stop_codon:yes gene_type:complete